MADCRTETALDPRLSMTHPRLHALDPDSRLWTAHPDQRPHAPDASPCARKAAHAMPRCDFSRLGSGVGGGGGGGGVGVKHTWMYLTHPRLGNPVQSQAYFFRRKLGAGPFFNGAVVALRDGVLVPADDLKSTDMSAPPLEAAAEKRV
eukprot:333356-Rhodomonas_salina.1